MQPLFRVTLHHRGGRLLVAKAAAGDGVTALQRETEALGALGHPGIARVAAVDQGPGWMVLWTLCAGIHTLRSAPPCPLPVAVRRAGQVMATIAYLHGRGLAHHRMRAEHVVVGPGGEAVLCGLRRTGPADGSVQATETSTAAALVAATIANAASGHMGPASRWWAPRKVAVEACLTALRESGAPARELALLLAEAATGATAPGPATDDPVTAIRPIAQIRADGRVRPDGVPPRWPAADPAG